MEREDTLSKCISGFHDCSETNPCPMHSEFKTIRAQLNKLFQKKTIQNLADKMKDSNIFINNSKKKSLKNKDLLVFSYSCYQINQLIAAHQNL